MRRALAALAALAAACATAPPVAPAAPVGAGEGSPLAVAATPEGRCARGDAPACREVGRARLLGIGAVADDRLAAAYATAGCELGDPGACSDLAVLRAIGRGIAQDDAKATALARRACDAGFGLGCSNLGTLLVAGAGQLAASPEDQGQSGARILELFRGACDAEFAEGCLDLGTALERGDLYGGDLRRAALAYRRACDAGLALGCYRLALLAADQPAAAPGAAVEPLARRACEAAIAPACARVHRPIPAETAATPTPRLVDDPRSYALGITGAGGFHPADLAPAPGDAARARAEVRRPPLRLLDRVPPALRARLELNLPPRADEEDDLSVALLLPLRRQELGACYEEARTAPRSAAHAFVAFLVERDGRPGEVRAAAEPADPELEACAADAVKGWSFPIPAGGLGGPYLVEYAFDAAPAGPAPAYTPPGGLRPSLRDPGCIERALRVPPGARGTTASVTVKLAVDGAGAPSLVHPITPAPEPLVDAVRRAVEACAWVPGADEQGRAVPLWVTETVDVAGR